jgi:hypothetical protein
MDMTTRKSECGSKENFAEVITKWIEVTGSKK